MTVRATGLILAGGGSRRMGTTKARLVLDGVSLISRVAHALQSVCDPVWIIGNDPTVAAGLGLPVLPDAPPGGSVIHGLLAGLRASETDLAVVVGCDMPYLQNSLLKHQLERAIDYDVVVILGSHGVEPLHAVYRRSVLPALEKLAVRPGSALRDLLPDARTLVIDAREARIHDPMERSAINVNTPEDLRRVVTMGSSVESRYEAV